MVIGESFIQHIYASTILATSFFPFILGAIGGIIDKSTIGKSLVLPKSIILMPKLFSNSVILLIASKYKVRSL